MSNYKKLANCPKTFLIKYHNEAIDDAQLYVYEYPANNSTEYGYTLYAQGNIPGIRKDVYLGYEDANNIFEGKLSEAISNQGGNFQLDCNDDQCSGHFSFSGTDDTGAPIKFSLNTCTQDRLITFSYNKLPIFQIQQTYKKELKIGDVLYSTNDNKLTLDAQTNGVNNTPIAICVIPDVYENFEKGDDSEGGVHTARFVSLNYMNYNTPATGSKEAKFMCFGNYGTEVGNSMGGTNGTSYVGGKWNTKRCVFKATNQDKTSDKVDNNPGKGYCAPACCCDRYSTPGTKPGDWYLPSTGELSKLYENKTTIDKARTALVGSGFSESNGYWSSFEYSISYEYRVYLDDGTINYGVKDDYNFYVLGFLAVEVSSFNIPSFKPQVNMDPVKLDP